MADDQRNDLGATGGTVSARVMSPLELSAADYQAWNDLCSAERIYDTPLLRPGFAKMVAARRPDTRAALFRRGRRLVGAFAFHARPGGFARPAGAPYSDYAGPVLAPDAGLSAQDCLRLAGLSAYRFANTPDPRGVFQPYADEHVETRVIDLAGHTPEAFYESRRAAHPKRFKNFRRLRNQVERGGGVFTFHAGPPEMDVLARFLEWKRAQLVESGLVDMTRAGGGGRVLKAVAEGEAPECRGWMFRLDLNGEPIAAHYGLRCENVFHAWIAAYDPAQAAISPGHIFMKEALFAMPAAGLSRYDLGAGHEHFKKYYANDSVDTVSGLVASASLQGRLQGLGYAAWRPFGDGGAAGRLRRRLDHVAVCETATGPRLAEIGRVAALALRGGGARQIGHAGAD